MESQTPVNQTEKVANEKLSTPAAAAPAPEPKIETPVKPESPVKTPAHESPASNSASAAPSTLPKKDSTSSSKLGKVGALKKKMGDHKMLTAAGAFSVVFFVVVGAATVATVRNRRRKAAQRYYKKANDALSDEAEA